MSNKQYHSQQLSLQVFQALLKVEQMHPKAKSPYNCILICTDLHLYNW